MKVKITRRKRSASIEFRAIAEGEGVALRDAVLASVKNGSGFDLKVIAEELQKRGVVAEVETKYAR